ncbi:MAG: hypothetical protein AMXMBFR56_80840 [Polyangiaceae bacterium]
MTAEPLLIDFPQPIASGAVGTWYEMFDAAAPESYLVHIAWPAAGDGG